MNARGYLTLAEVLMADIGAKRILTTELEPAASRSAISRAYYAAHLVAYDFLDSIGVRVLENAHTHLGVINALNNGGDTVLSIISTNLGSLHTGRNNADYKSKIVAYDKKEYAGTIVDLAKQIITGLDDLSAGKSKPPLDRKAVKAKILDWAQKTLNKNVVEKK